MLGRARWDAEAVAGGLWAAGSRTGLPRSVRGCLEWSRMSWKQSMGSPRGSRPLGGARGRRPGSLGCCDVETVQRRVIYIVYRTHVGSDHGGL